MLTTDFSKMVYKSKYGDVPLSRKAEFLANRVLTPDIFPRHASTLKKDFCHYINEGTMLPGGRFLYVAERPRFNAANCFAFGVQDSKEGWARVLHDVTLASMMGGGCGIDGSKIRPRGSFLSSGGYAAGPLSLFQIINELGKYIEQGGSRRVALMFLLHCCHPDILDFIKSKRGNGLQNANLSVIFNTREEINSDIFEEVIKASLEFGDPSPSINCLDCLTEPQQLRNACGEVISSKNGTACVLGAVNLAKFTNMRSYDIGEVAYNLSLFLLASVEKIEAPTPEIKQVIMDEHRIGVEVTGLYEYLLMTGGGYTPSCILRDTLNRLCTGVEEATEFFQKSTGYKSVAQLSFGPTGSLSILLETSSGIEPLYAPAYIRRTRGKDSEITETTIIDPLADRLDKLGICIKDTAVELGESVEGIRKKFAMLLFLQDFCDQGISTTINVKKFDDWSSKEVQEIVALGRSYAPYLRGFTFYPAGARDSQPLEPISLVEAEMRLGKLQSSDICELNGRGECS